MITAKELDKFQQCPMLWKLSKEKKVSRPVASPIYTISYKTLHRMYSVWMANNKPQQLVNIENYWDRLWRAKISKLQSQQAKAAHIEAAASGWMRILNYYTEIYKTQDEIPCAVNADLHCILPNLHLQIHADIVLILPDSSIKLVEIGGSTNKQRMYNSLSTLATLVGLQSQLKHIPISKFSHIDITGNKPTFSINSFYPNQGKYMEKAQKIIYTIGAMIHNEIVYPSVGGKCQNCQYKAKCWI